MDCTTLLGFYVCICCGYMWGVFDVGKIITANSAPTMWCSLCHVVMYCHHIYAIDYSGVVGCVCS